MLSRTIPLGLAALSLGCGSDPVRAGEPGTGDSSTGSDNDSTGNSFPTAPGTTGSSGEELDTTDADTDSSSEGGATTEAPWPRPDPGPFCGDGTVDPDEECDDGDEPKKDGPCNDDCVVSAAILWDTVVPPKGEGACGETVAVSDAGAIVVGGTSRMGDEHVNAWLGALDEQGELQWSQSWDGGGGERDEVLDVDTDAQGNVYAFTTQQITFQRGWLSKRNPSGVEAWNVQLLTEAGENSTARSLAVDADGTATVLGMHWGDYEGHRMQRFDTDGVPVWAVDIHNGLSIAASSIDLDPLGGIRVALMLETKKGARATILRFDEMGAPSWSAQSGPPPGGDPQGATSAEGISSLVLRDQFDSQLVVRSWDSNGANPDAFAPGFERNITLSDAAYGPEGDLYVVGHEHDAAWTLRIDPSGALAWSRRNSEARYANAVAVAPGGDVVVAGCTESTDGAIWVRRYSP
ncbi:MAG: hypothetical protein ACRBN8_19455 [Nannocystales bacterium]